MPAARSAAWGTRWRSRLLLALLCGAAGLSLLSGPASAQPGAGTVFVAELRGAVTPVTADYLIDAVADASAADAALLLIEMDTPGGLVDSTREIVSALLESPVPVAVYVTPSGARAASAGTFITLSAHVAAMTPGSTIGAATPVDMEGGEVGDKVVEDAASWAEAIAEERGRDVDFAVASVREGRSVTATRALDVGAIDLLARSREALLAQIDGRRVTLADGATVTLATASAPITEYQPSLARRILQAVANPNLAFLFISLGTLAILYEIASPGLGIGGVAGAIMLVMAFYAMAVLPTNLAGLALLVLALALLVAEFFVPGVGVLAGGGALALLAAGLLLFQRSSGLMVAPLVLVPTVLLAGAGAVGIGVLARRLRGRPAATGAEALVGAEAQVRWLGDGRAQVFVHGELWQARWTDGQPEVGERVRVVDQDGLELTVEKEP